MTESSHLSPEPVARPVRRHLQFQLVAWGFFFVVDVLMLTTYGGASLARVLKLAFGIVVTALLSELIWRAAARIGWSEQRWLRLPLFVGLACVAGGLLAAAVQLPLEHWMATAGPEPRPPASRWSALSVFHSMILLLWSVFAAAFYFYDRARQAEVERAAFAAAARDAQLQSLRLQINPHFLFNSFASLRALVEVDPERARDAITRLAGMMRYALQSAGARTVAFADELEMVDSYLRIERLRLADRLRVNRDIEDGIGQLRVPPLCLQTLVENAVKFGAANRRSGGEVSFSARREHGTLRIRVTNSGSMNAPSESTGLGLSNLRARLGHLYRGEASFALRSEGSDQVCAELVVPLSAPGA